MKRIKCSYIGFREYADWINLNLGGAINLGWKSNVEKFKQPEYTVGWKSISAGKGGMYWVFKNAEDATAFKLKFSL